MNISNPFDDVNPLETDIQNLDFDEISFRNILDKTTTIEINSNRHIYKILVKNVIEGIKNGCIIYNQNNRFVDKTRIFNGFDIDLTEPIIFGFRNEKYYILDGQHRIEYLKSHIKYMESSILVDIRKYEDEGEFIRQLKIINDRRIMEVKIDSDPVKIKYSEFVELFLHNRHFTVQFKRNRPYVNPETLMNVIISSDYFRSSDTSGKDVFNKIIEINQFISHLDKSKWSIDIKVEELYVQKTKETRYFLAFDKEYHPIKELIDLEKSTFDAKWNDFLMKKRKKKFVFK
jgi:hypothetical protein